MTYKKSKKLQNNIKNLIMYIFISMILLINNSFSQYFVSGFEDLPLMNGLEQNKEYSYFDTLSGKIIESTATLNNKDIDRKEIEEFYKNTLPSLGWTRLKANIYTRDNELLKIEIQSKEENKDIEIRYFLQPKGLNNDK